MIPKETLKEWGMPKKFFLRVLFGCGAAMAAGPAETKLVLDNPFFAFDNGIGRGSMRPPQQAALLKDRILMDTGGARQDIITRDDSKQLESAERLFSERNYAESYSIVQVLLQKESNRYYPRLLDLQEKLERRLGIQ